MIEISQGEKSMPAQKIEITSKTILTTILYLLGFWLLFQVRGIIITLFVAFIFMTAISPVVRAAKRIRIPTLPVVLLIFIAVIALISTLVASLVPAVMIQTRSLIQNLPDYINMLNERWSIALDQSVITNQFNAVPSNLLSIAAGAFNNVLTILALFFMTYYLFTERPHLHKYLVGFFGTDEAEKKAEAFIVEVESRVGGWVRGELFLMTVIGVLSYIGLTILGIPYALPLAILAGLLEAVPGIGPIISAIPAILLGLTISPVIALGATIMSIVIQQLENNLIVPKIMQSATGVRPLMTIIVLMTGFTLGGALGAVLAMPIFLTINSIYKVIHK